MKHWIGVMCIGAALAIAGLLTAPENAENALVGDPGYTADQVSSGLLTGGGIIALIGLVGVAKALMSKPEEPPPPTH